MGCCHHGGGFAGSIVGGAVVISIAAMVLYLAFWLAIVALGVWLFVRIVRAAARRNAKPPSAFYQPPSMRQPNPPTSLQPRRSAPQIHVETDGDDDVVIYIKRIRGRSRR